MRRHLVTLLAVLAVTTVSLAGCGKSDSLEQASKKNTAATSENEQKSISEDAYWDQKTDNLEVRAYDKDARAQYVLGVNYDMGRNGLQQNFATAMQWYQQSAENGYGKADTQLGYMYLNGCGTDVDYDKANTYFQEAVKQGDPEGNVGLARVLLARDSTANAAAAYNANTPAVTAGNPDGLLLQAYMQLNGIGCTQDQTGALNLYTELAGLKTKDPTETIVINEANTQLGMIYANALGVTQDYAQALRYFTAAADAGYAKAQYYEGILYENGLGRDQDYKQAMSCFRQAADQDYAPALNQIGYLYYNGFGVDADPSQAAYYQKLAAAQGYAPAQVNLGYLYENGYGVGQDYDTALAYYKLAEAQGYEGTSESVARVQNLIAQRAGQTPQAAQ